MTQGALPGVPGHVTTAGRPLVARTKGGGLAIPDRAAEATTPGLGTYGTTRTDDVCVDPGGEVLLAIDPGTTRSAWVTWDGVRVLSHGYVPNEELLELVNDGSHCAVSMAVEGIASYGMAVGAEVFTTCIWIGRFVQAWVQHSAHVRSEPLPRRLVYRRDVKLHICGNMRANDASVRQAVLDRFGGKEAAVGRKAAPGPLYGLHGDEWSALALALTAAET